MKIIKSEKYNRWYRRLDLTQKTLIDVRLTRILIDSHFGVYKNLGDIFELKFSQGIRIYFVFDGESLILLLNGGGKNNKRDQAKDIFIARQIYQEYLNGK